MKLTHRLLSALAILASMMAAPAVAADSDQIIPAPVIEDNYVPVEIGTGWYIRGDVGYNFGGRQNSQLYDLTPVTFDNSYADGLNVGVGFGYRFNDIFRMDTTIDRVFGGKFSNTQLVAPTGPCIGTGEYVDVDTGVVYLDDYPIINCLRKDESSYNVWYAMGNAYADLGTFNGFTPFLGAGLGVAKINWSEETNSITCIPVEAGVHREACNALGTVAQPPYNAVYTEPGVLNNGSNWKLAMSLTAGVSYELSKGLHLDTSYKFTSIGGGFGSIPYGPTPGSSIAKDGFGLHQVKMGLRYEIW
jgi:opacity protein-like surface antigen